MYLDEKVISEIKKWQEQWMDKIRYSRRRKAESILPSETQVQKGLVATVNWEHSYNETEPTLEIIRD